MVTIIVQIHEIIDYHNKIQVIRPALKKKMLNYQFCVVCKIFTVGNIRIGNTDKTINYYVGRILRHWSQVAQILNSKEHKKWSPKYLKMNPLPRLDLWQFHELFIECCNPQRLVFTDAIVTIKNILLNYDARANQQRLASTVGC